MLYSVVRSCALTRIECVKIGAIAYNELYKISKRINKHKILNYG